MKITQDGLTANVYYDDRGSGYRGWYAEYFDADGVIDDSEKVGHTPMPVRRDAARRAETLARAHLRQLARRFRGCVV